MTLDGTNISMTRGDDESLTISLKDTMFTSEDTIEMTIRKRASSKDVLFYKKITAPDSEGKMVIGIDSDDTSSMAFGSYVYDIQWTDSSGKRHTIVKPPESGYNFTLLKEVTYGTN